MNILAIDPGDRIGFCIIESKPKEKQVLIVSAGVIYFQNYMTELPNLLSVPNHRPEFVIVEDWLGYTRTTSFSQGALKANTVNRMIGATHYACVQNKLPFRLQAPQVRELARTVFNYASPSHDPDHLSAMLHGLSFLLQCKEIDPRFTIHYQNGAHELANFKAPHKNEVLPKGLLPIKDEKDELH